MIFAKRNTFSLEINGGTCISGSVVVEILMLITLPQKKKKIWNKTYTTLKHVTELLTFKNGQHIRRTIHVQHGLIFGIFL